MSGTPIARLPLVGLIISLAVPPAIAQDGAGASMPSVDTSKTTANAPFVSCPVDLLRSAWSEVLPETALETAAVEAEVLRLCSERQDIINTILRKDAELAGLMAVSNAVEPTKSSPTPVPAAPQMPATPSQAPSPRSDTSAAPTPAMSAPVDDIPAAGTWAHHVRYKVRAKDGPWKAAISSLFTPAAPAPRPEQPDDAEIAWGIPEPPPPEPPISRLLTTGEALPDGQVIVTISADAVLVRPQNAAAQTPVALPAASMTETDIAPSCAVPKGADARDLMSCRKDAIQ